MPKRGYEVDFLEKTAVVSTIFVTVLIIAEVLAVIMGLGDVFTLISEGVSMSLAFVVPVLVRVGNIHGLALDIYWIAILSMFLISVLMVFWQSKGMVGHGTGGKANETPLYWIGLTFGSSLVIQMFMIMLLFGGGHGIDVPDLPTDISESILLYTNAGVWEELVSRVLLIGVPMMVIAALLHYRNPLRYLLGGFGISKTSVLLIVVSAAFFSIGHIDGWGLSKVPLVMVGGLIMGWLFVRFGIHASIVFHCLTDLLTVAIETFPFISIVYLGVMLLGMVCTLFLAYILFKKLRSVRDLPLIEEAQDSILRRRD